MKELEQEINEVEVKEIEQIPNTYYYDKIYKDQHLGPFTEDTQLAYQLGWQDNHVLISDTEVSELDGWTYLKGYAPKKTEEQKLNELAQQIRAKRNSLLNQTDYLMMPDYPIAKEYQDKIKAYRQTLRDITAQESFPENVVFPTLPELEENLKSIN